MTPQMVAILAPLWADIDDGALMDTLECGANTVDQHIETAKKTRAKLQAATQEAVLDTAVLNRLADEANGLVSAIAVELTGMAELLADTDAKIRAVETAWREHLAAQGSRATKKAKADTDSHDLLAIAQHECQQLRIERDEFRRELSRLKEKERALDHVELPATASLQIEPGLIRKVMFHPDKLTPVEILRYIQSVSDGRLRILPSAWRSAEKASNYESPKRLLTLMDRLMFDYAPEIAAGKTDREAGKILGSNYTAKESATVENSESLRAERTFILDGQPVYFGRHLKLGNSPTSARGLRIYFEFIDGQVVIGYCGEHLTTAARV